MSDLTFAVIAQFFKDRARDLRRIVSHSHGDVSLGEMHGEVWIEAEELGRKRGAPLDLTAPADQEWLLGRLYNRLVKFAEHHFRNPVRLDGDSDDDDVPSVGAKVSRTLAASSASAPDAGLEQRQHEDEVEATLARSYSEAAAYIILLMRFHWQAGDLASYLQVALATLRWRMRIARARVEVQSSLFDGIDQISRDFQANIKALRHQPIRVELAGDQWKWEF